jgi:hypothetical protein
MNFRTALIGIAFLAACRPDEAAVTAPPAVSRSLTAAGDQKPVGLFEGITLSTRERDSFSLINARYNEQIRLMRNALPNPHGPIDAVTLNKLRALREAQFAEWRGVMSPTNAARFASNRQLVDAQWAEMRRKIGTPTP